MDDGLPRLARELTSISAAVRSVGAPPLPTLAAPYHVRVADPDDDAALVSGWMNDARLVEAWEYDHPPPWWRGHLRAQLSGEYSRPLIGSHRGVDFAYLEVYRAAKDSIAPHYAADPHDLGLHAAIADPQFLDRGVAATVLPRVAASLFASEPRCRRLVFDPDHRNVRARAVCISAGCTFLGEHDMANRRMALYVLPRTAADVPQPLVH